MTVLDPSAGRSELEQLVAGKTKRTQRLAWRVARMVAAAVSKGDNPSDALDAAMAAVGMAKAVRDEVGAAVVQSLLMGAGVWPSVSARVEVSALGKTALDSIWDGSSMTLSQRLHGSDQAMRSDLVDIIKTHVQAKTSAWDASRQIFDGYGFGGTIHKDRLPELPKEIQDLLRKAGKVVTPEDLAQLKQDAKRLEDYASRLATGPLKAAYTQFARRLEKGLTTGLDKLVETATYEKARYNASRILRTESARAWGQGFFEDCRKDPDVVGIRWALSSSHTIFDICDFYASADLYGMGPGVYPLGKAPWYPAHPHCMCPLAKVYKWQVPAAKDQVQQGGAVALAKMTDSQRKHLMTIRGAQAFQTGGNWQSGLRGWSGMGGDALSSGAKTVLAQAQDAVKAFTVPKTVSQAEAYIRSLGIEARLSGMTIDHAQEVSRALHQLVEVEGLPKIQEISLDRGRTGGAMQMVQESFLFLGREALTPGEWARSRAAVNAKQANMLDRWKASSDQIKAMVPEPSARYFVSDSIYDTVIHEYGHFIHSLSFGRNVAAQENEILGFEEFTGSAPRSIPIRWAHRPGPDPQKRAELRKILSEYATADVFESFAEAFNAKYSKGEILPEEWDRVIQSAVEKAKRSVSRTP